MSLFSIMDRLLSVLPRPQTPMKKASRGLNPSEAFIAASIRRVTLLDFLNRFSKSFQDL